MTLVSDARAIAREGIRAVDPALAVREHFKRSATGYRLGTVPLRPGPRGELHLVAIGKAAAAMADSASRVAGHRPSGIAVTPIGYPAPRSGIRGIYGDHPLPGARSFRAGAELLHYVEETEPSDAILFLLSGGGSAVAEVADGSLRPSEIRRTTQILLASGVPIGAMNAVRRHLSRIKGGRLTCAAGARSFGTLALSDVVGDPPADIASGPTVPDPTTYEDALAVLRRYRITARIPPRVVNHLRRGARGLHPETPKPRDRRFRGAPYVLAATNRTALRAAAVEATRRGYAARILSGHLIGETRPVARAFARRLVAAAEEGRVRSLALLAGGETTVTLGPHPGRGGRNQEFALAAAGEIAGRDALVLSIGTDGIDGPTDAAGGWTDGRTLERARRRSIDIEGALRSHSAYDALRSLGTLLRTGPTGTNVMDLHVGLARSPFSPGTEESSRRSAAPSSRRRRS